MKEQDLTTYISLLRGVNVSGQKIITMSDLQRVYEALDFSNVRTYLQSGNVIYDSVMTDYKLLVGLIENQVEKTFSFSVPVFLFVVADFARIINDNPFAEADPATLSVTFLSALPTEDKLKGLENPGEAGDRYSLIEKAIYLCLPNGYGRTKLNNNFFERKLGMPATTRNWKTVNALFELAKAG